MPLPDHDVAIVIASDSEECRDALRKIERAAPRWPRPLLNSPQRVGNLDRDKLHRLLSGIAGLDIPSTEVVTRVQLSGLVLPEGSAATFAADWRFPIIIRPRGSHAGVGLAKIDDSARSAAICWTGRSRNSSSRVFVDYADEDGLFRKYRIVFVDGRAYACHMAVAARWDIWYLNAAWPSAKASRRKRPISCRHSTAPFAARHQRALTAMADRVGLDYFTVDCAENKRGELLIFEADNTAVVHNMDSPDVFPYKAPQMHKIFDAFAAMLYRRAESDRERAA